MRVTSNNMMNSYLKDVQKNLQGMNKINNQISTGNQVNKVSDDPLKAVKIMNLNNEISDIERYNSNEVFAYTLFIDDYCSYLGWAANTISHYEIEKVNYPKEDQPFIKWYYPQFAIGLGEVPEKIDSIFNNEIQNILNDGNTLISEDNFEQYQAEVYDSIIEGFKKAIENIDKKKTNNVIFFVSIVDSDNTEIMENYSAEQLNSYDKFVTFKNRFQSKP